MYLVVILVEISLRLVEMVAAAVLALIKMEIMAGQEIKADCFL
jgi:hypothetical protein